MPIETITALALGALVPIVVGGIVTAIYRAVRRRVLVQSPESRQLEQLVPLVNALARTTGPQNDALIAILEAQKGICNGNVDRALEKMRTTRDEFNAFLVSSARIGGGGS